MWRTGRQEEKCEVYKVITMNMLMYNYATWTGNVWTYIKNQNFRQEIINKILEGRVFLPATRNFMKDFIFERK